MKVRSDIFLTTCPPILLIGVVETNPLRYFVSFNISHMPLFKVRRGYLVKLSILNYLPSLVALVVCRLCPFLKSSFKSIVQLEVFEFIASFGNWNFKSWLF
jgi:hypothetical protein